MRAVLNQALLASSVVIYAPATITTLDRGPREAVLTLSDGRRLARRWWSGAEGRNSAVRQMAGIGTWAGATARAGWWPPSQLERPHEATAYQYFMAGGPLAILPLTGRPGQPGLEREGRAGQGADAPVRSRPSRRICSAASATSSAR